MQVNGSHRTTPAYSAWGFNQLYGAAVVENAGLAHPVFKFEEPNVFLQENAEGNLEPIHYSNLIYALQLLQTYTICDVDHSQEEIKAEKDQIDPVTTKWLTEYEDCARRGNLVNF